MSVPLSALGRCKRGMERATNEADIVPGRQYKNVLDSSVVSVEQDVTTLVGMKESGNSTMLDALYKLNPVYGDRFVERDDYPAGAGIATAARKTSRRSRPSRRHLSSTRLISGPSLTPWVRVSGAARSARVCGYQRST